LGEVISSKVEFYSLDEFSSTLFFSLALILALFWAELYYISVDRADVFVWWVRPIANLVMMSAFVAVSVCSYIVSTSYANDVDYVFLQYTVLITTIYLVAAVMFAYYAYMAAAELNNVPIVLSARRDRLSTLRVLAVICISALILKAGVLIYLNGREIETVSIPMLVSVYFYYFFCELFPMCIILMFYRVEPLSTVDTGSDDGEVEKMPISGAGGGGAVVNSQSKKKPSRTLRSKSPMRAAGRASNPEVVDAIIARLSLETGMYIEEMEDDFEPALWTDSGEEDGLLAPRRFIGDDEV
jgi:Protein of unknown function (DUF1084)